MSMPIQAPPVVRNASQAKLNMNSVFLSTFHGPDDQIRPCPAGFCCCESGTGVKACIPCSGCSFWQCYSLCISSGYAAPC